ILMTVLLALAPSNMELAESAILQALQELPENLSYYGADEILIEIIGEHSGNWLIEQTISSILHENGITVFERDVNPDSSCMILRVRPMELLVEYGDVSRPWIIGSKRVERIAKCELSSTLLDTDASIIMTIRTSGIEEDKILWSDAEVLDGSEEWEWLSGDLPENRGGGILEPIIVSGVVASLVYLFYSSRAE
ncbi:MAG: hypothetical protein KAT09_09470, partial [Candidatus Aegiribacteria sp.]|nr:hypothetical protein [Candidatus Aegiribacteria sp.]